MPLMPLFETAGKDGGTDPAQNARIFVNVGVNTGLDRMIPVNRLVAQPLISNSKFE